MFVFTSKHGGRWLLWAVTSSRPILCNRKHRYFFSLMGFEDNLAQMIIMTTRCVANKNHVARSKVKVTVRTLALCIDFSETCSCPAHKFVMHGGN